MLPLFGNKRKPQELHLLGFSNLLRWLNGYFLKNLSCIMSINLQAICVTTPAITDWIKERNATIISPPFCCLYWRSNDIILLFLSYNVNKSTKICLHSDASCDNINLINQQSL